MDIRCLWPERAATADWRSNTGAEPAESGGHTLAAAPCHNQFYGIRSLGLVIVAMFGIGWHSIRVSSMHVFAGGYDVHVILGAYSAGYCLRTVVNIVGDAGYIILLPIAATLFQSVVCTPLEV